MRIQQYDQHNVYAIVRTLPPPAPKIRRRVVHMGAATRMLRVYTYFYVWKENALHVACGIKAICYLF